MNLVPLLVIAALFVVLMIVSSRSKAKRAAADAERRRSITAGTRIMTTSGLHATVVAVDPANDGSQADTVLLQVARGVEVTWALAAVREAPTRTVVDAPTAAPTTAPSVAPAVDAPLGTDAGPAAAPGDPVRLSKPKGRTADR